MGSQEFDSEPIMGVQDLYYSPRGYPANCTLDATRPGTPTPGVTTLVELSVAGLKKGKCG